MNVVAGMIDDYSFLMYGDSLVFSLMLPSPMLWGSLRGGGVVGCGM